MFILLLKYSLFPVLRRLHWVPVRCCINYKILVIVFKCLHALAPTCLTELLETRQQDRRLRHTDTLFLHQSIKKHEREQAFGPAAPRLWNSLSAQHRSLTTSSAFKTVLKTYLFKQYCDC